jgi:hypothetical protein
MGRPNGGGTERSTQRIEAFSDGVFAIAITGGPRVRCPKSHG